MHRLALPAALLFLTACGPPSIDDRVDAVVPPQVEAEDSSPKLGEIELCDARDYRPLIGKAVEATTFVENRMLRVYGVNDIVTNDYIPQRTNVVYNEKGVITKAFCG